jgi:hypothetical protein
MREVFCLRCHAIGKAKDLLTAETIAVLVIVLECLGAEVVPWILVLPVVLASIVIFLLFETRFTVCGTCASTNVIPSSSPRARQTMEEHGLDYEKTWKGAGFASKQ